MNEEYLQHHGILGMKWGIRRYQNPDGSYTPAGKKRYGLMDVNTDGPQHFSRRGAIVDGPQHFSRRGAIVDGPQQFPRRPGAIIDGAKQTSKNLIKAKLGIYKDGDDNPYVSERRRKNRNTEFDQYEKMKQKEQEYEERKAQKKVKNVEKKEKRNKSDDYSEDYRNTHDKKDVKYMSDKELQQRINRLNNEKQYKSLSKSDTRKALEGAGKKFFQTAVVSVLTGLAANEVRKRVPEIINAGKDMVDFMRDSDMDFYKWLNK